MAREDSKQLTKRLNIPTFKPLRPQEVQVRPFIVNKEFVLSEIDTGSVVVMKGLEDTGSLFDSSTFSTNSNGTFQKQIFDSVKHLYYEFAEEPINTFGITSTNRIFKTINQEITILGLSQNDFGEAIKPGTIEIVNSGITVLDDFNGNLYDLDESASFAVSKSEYTIGNVFYEHGNIVFTDNGQFASQSILVQDFVTGSFQLTYKNIHTVYEWSICCTVEADEFNLTFNPTILSSSISSSTGEELLSSWINGTSSTPGEFGFDTTFQSSGRTILLAEHTASDFGGAVSNVFPVTKSKSYRVDFVLNHIFGTLPDVNIRTGSTGAGTVFSNTFTAVNGTNTQILTATTSSDNLVLNFQINPGPGSFSTKDISIKEVLPDQLDVTNTIRGELVTGSEWSPYITTIGLYDDIHLEPLAVAKLARPIKNDKDLPINFVVRFDL